MYLIKFLQRLRLPSSVSYAEQTEHKDFCTTAKLTPLGILFATACTSLVMAAMELVHVPQTAMSSWQFLKIPLLALDGFVHHQKYQFIYIFQIGFLLYAYPYFLRLRKWIAASGIIWSVLVTLCSYAEFTSYVRFQGYWPFMIAFGLAAVFLSGTFLYLLPVEPPIRFSGISRRLYLWGPFISLILIGTLLHVVNFHIFENVYPTLHLALFQFTFVLMVPGIAIGVSGLQIPVVSNKVFQWVVVGIWGHLLFLVPQFADSPWLSESKPLYDRYTILGQANTIDHDIEIAEEGIPVDINTRGYSSKQFLQASNLPALPPSFSLRDYNILFVTVESLRYDQTSLYNPKWKNTPTLQRMVDDGAYTFGRAYSPSMKTMVSLSSIMAMTYPSFTKLALSRNPAYGRLLNSETTVAEHLQKAGYQTFRVSHNFARIFVRFNHGFEQGFDRNQLICTSHKRKKCDFDITNAAIDEIDESLKSNKPFFGWVFLSSPHATYLPHFSDMPSSTKIENFRQEIRYSDQQLARLLAHLKKRKLDKSTIVIVIGDHGEEFKEHGRTEHNSIYAETTNVAMVVKIPGLKGGSIQKPTATMYLFPWLFQQGPPHLKLASNKRIREDFGPILTHLNNAIVTELLGTKRSEVMLLSEGYRVHYDFASNYYELFNVKKDRWERKNLYDGVSPLSLKYKTLVKKYLSIRKSKQRVRF